MNSVVVRMLSCLGALAVAVLAAGCRKQDSTAADPKSKLVDAALEKAEAEAKKSPDKNLPPEDELASVAKETRAEAEQGIPESQYLLGVLLANGRGVARDFPEAYKWLQLAATQGDADASKALLLVRTLMSEKQIEEGRRRVAAFVPTTNAPAAKTNPRLR